MKSTSQVPDPVRGPGRVGSGRITDWPAGERPREKLLARGTGALSDAELLAILLRTGAGGATALDVARGLLSAHGSLRTLSGRQPSEFARLHGIGPAKAVELAAAFELGRRAGSEAPGERDVIRSPADVGRRMIPRLGTATTERFVVLVLDARNAVTAEVELSRGTLTASLVHPREVFKEAVDARGASVIVVHNHPSGNPEPSQEDLDITRQLAEAGKILGIPLHDHVIVAGTGYVSLAEKGAV
jgi:DNA repair protein RadC